VHADRFAHTSTLGLIGVIEALSEPTDGAGMTTPRRHLALPWRVVAVDTACFAIAFAAWVMLGPSSRALAAELDLSPATANLLKSLPILVGSVMRIPVGLLTDRFGAKRVYPAVLLLGAAGAGLASLGSSAASIGLAGLVLGIVGTSFTVGAQSVASQSPSAVQGTALGIFGAGNVGTALTTAIMPLLLGAMGWRGAFRAYAALLVMAAIGHALLAPSAPRPSVPTPLRALLAPLADMRTLRFGLYYTATFGVFVATALALTDVYVDGYHLPLATAGLLATAFAVTASLVRVVGGMLADRHGARRVLRASLLGVFLSLIPITSAPPLAVAFVLIVVAGAAMGIGMGATFRYIPAHFPTSVGAVGGVVGALGGLGGFFLPNLGAACVSALGSPFASILPLASVALVALVVQALAVRATGSTRDRSKPLSLVPPAPARLS